VRVGRKEMRRRRCIALFATISSAAMRRSSTWCRAMRGIVMMIMAIRILMIIRNNKNNTIALMIINHHPGIASIPSVSNMP